ncbi:MAG TPA: DUF3179 domain-containing (seleno)protein [Acidobacteriaceae bacterium]|nr:DUF3179 domain-containing (seleno)protein [Acidobacteriaceae bacterium]
MASLRTSAIVVSAVVVMLVAVASVAVPLYVIRPFVPEDPHALVFALGVRPLAPWIALFCVIILLLIAASTWNRTRRAVHAAFVSAIIIAGISLVAAHVDIFERMFHPNPMPSFAPASEAAVDPGDMVLAVNLNGHSRAYPIRYLGYHHIINDIVGGDPIAVTYCTLCHTGLVWSRILDGRTLYFHLAGINNGNALLRDAETSSIWQQSTGECIFGHLRGRHLTLISSNELTLALWRHENPKGTILRPVTAVLAQYDPKDWEQHVARTRVVVDVSASGIDPHEIIFGVSTNGLHRAYFLRTLLASQLIQDKFGDPATRVLLVLGPDNASIRAFAPGDLTFVRTQNPSDSAFMTDMQTGSAWNFQGCAVAGSLRGQCLAPIDGHKSFWFDWLNHYRNTSVYRS